VIWPGICDAPCLLESGAKSVRLLKSDSLATVAELPTPHWVDEAHAVTIRPEQGSPPFLAVVGLLLYKGNLFVGLQAIHSEIYLFDANRRLVYDEVLPEEVHALASLPSRDGKSETLLVGGENRVWQYTIGVASNSAR